jgi:hypothetical protein
MTAPHKPSCSHVTNVTVADGPHQIVYDGQTYLAGDTITDVPADTADYWITNGWAKPPATKTPDTAKPAPRSPAKPAGKK